MITAHSYEKAFSLRLGGKSYSQISTLTNIPKSTLCSWFSDKEWSKKIKFNLTKANLSKRNKGLVLARKIKAINVLKRHFVYRNRALKEFKILKEDPFFLAGLCLYWGEGNKANPSIVSIANTDPNLLKLEAYFYRNYLRVPEDKLRVGLFLYRDIEEKSAKDFWSRVLKVPSRQFIKTQILKSNSQLTRRKSKHGICSLYFSNTEFGIKIQEWIRLLSLEVRE